MQRNNVHWRVVAASVQGSSHIATGQPCQDANHWAVLPDGTLVAAVADGAGSTEFGGEGARIAVLCAVDAVTSLAPAVWPSDIPAWRKFFNPVLEGARLGITAAAAMQGRLPRDYATTLVVAVATADQVVAVQIGDGASVVSELNLPVQALTIPVSGEFANQTTFLTSPNAIDTAQIRVLQTRATGVALLSDGLQMLALKIPPGIPHEGFFRPLLEFAGAGGDNPDAELAAFLGSPKVIGRTDDDVTLLLAVRTQ